MSDDRQQEEVRSGTHHQGTEVRLVVGGFIIVLVLGGLLIYLVFGTAPAMLGVAIILLVFGVMLALYRGLGLLEAWLKRDD